GPAGEPPLAAPSEPPPPRDFPDWLESLPTRPPTRGRRARAVAWVVIAGLVLFAAVRVYLDVRNKNRNRQAIDRVNQALACLKGGRMEEALSHCDEAIRLDPTIAEAYVNRAAALLGKGEY